MSGPLIVPTALAKSWLADLLKLWGRIRRERCEELQAITNVFGNSELLANSYIEPDCQMVNPADHHEDEPFRVLRQPIWDWINEFLKGEFFERDGRNTTLILSDAGMGKTSLLMMLKFTHLCRFWPSGLEFRLLKLGPATIQEIQAIESANRTVLLLDALDEDPQAWGRAEDRLTEILQAVRNFRQVLLTCRTQFFPKGGNPPIEQPGKMEILGFVCNLLYLAPFNDNQVERFLGKLYPNSRLDALRKWITDSDNRRLENARRVLLSMHSLRMRPLLLSYMDDFLSPGTPNWTDFSVYESLVGNWLLREQRKNPALRKSQLWRACQTVAMHLQYSKRWMLTRADLEGLLGIYPVARHITALDIGGRSLLSKTSDGSFRFAHYSIQEFLVAHSLLQSDMSKRLEPLTPTGQMVTFMMSTGRPIAWQDLFDFRGAELRGADLRTANLSGVKLQKAILEGADLRQANLSNADLRSVDLENANLQGANLQGADFSNAYLDGASFFGAELSGAYFGGADLIGANFRASRNLNQHQLEQANGSEDTRLPEQLTWPRHWLPP